MKLKKLAAKLISFIILAGGVFQMPRLTFGAVDQTLSKAQAAYQEARYESAVALYEAAFREGAKNGHVLYNLGNAYYRLAQYGNAIAAYRRALLDLPDHPDIKANLALAREHTKDRIDDQFEQNPLDRLAASLPELPKSFLRRVFLTIYAAGWIALLLAALMPQPLLKQAGVFLLIVSLPLGFLYYGVHASRDGTPYVPLSAEARRSVPAVVTSSEAKAYSGDGENYQVVFLLHDGAEISALSTRGDWVEAALPGARKGWLRSKDLAMITLETYDE